MNIYNEPLWIGNLAGYLAYIDDCRKITDADIEARGNYGEVANPQDDGLEGYEHMVQIEGNLSIVSVNGPLKNKESFWDKIFGGSTSYESIRNAVAVSANHPDVNAILLNVDSPGGMVTGVSEVAEFIKQISKKHTPVYAYTSGQMASAAYWIGAAAKDRWASQLSTVGSIGVIAVHKEISKMLEKEGITATVFREGKYKDLANPYEPLTDERKKALQAQLSTVYDVFTEFVAENVGLALNFVRTKAADGREFFGMEAEEVGLIKGVKTFDDVVSLLNQRHTTNKGNDGSFTNHQQAGIDMGKKILVHSEASLAALAANMTETEVEELMVSADAGADEGEGTPAEGEGGDGGEGEGDTSAAKTGKDEEDDDDDDDDDDGKGKPKAGDDTEASTSSMDALITHLAASQEGHAEAKAALKQKDLELTTLRSTHDSLLEIAVTEVNRMQVALGGSAVAMTGLAASVVIDTHANVLETYQKRFKVGATAKVPADEDRGNDGTPDQMQSFRQKATQINPRSK